MSYRGIDVSGFARVMPEEQPVPQVMWLPIERLVIDERYQRPLQQGNLKAIQRIAESFNWTMFTPILVAPITGGNYAIIDGQRRAHAAAICGFAEVPAMVALVAPREQAQAFVTINSSQIKVSGHALLRAALVAGEAWAVQADRAVADAGCRLMQSNFPTRDKKPGQVFCVNLIRRLCDAGHSGAVTKGLRAILDLDPTSVPNFASDLLTPWLEAVAENPRATADQLLAVLRAHRPWQVIEKANRLAAANREPGRTAQRRFFSALIAEAVRA